MIRGAIFDLDGTLLDSLNVWSEIDQRFFAQRHIPLPDDYAMAIQHLTLRETAVYTIERFHLKDTPEALLAIWYEMAHSAYANDISLIPGAKHYLDKLKQQHILLSIATTLDFNLAKAALEHHGIWHDFTAVTTSQEVQRNKNYPDIYLRTAQKMKLKPQDIVVFEDLETAIHTVKSAGFFSVRLNPHHEHTQADLSISDFSYFLKETTSL